MSIAIINGTILSAFLAAAVWLALRCIPRRALNAATRYAIWWLVLAASLALPGLFLKTPPAPTTHATGTRALIPITIQSLPLAPPAPPRFHLPPVLPLLWLFTSGILLLRLFVSHCAILRACALPPIGGESATAWRNACGARRNSVRIIASPTMPVPFAAGPFRPAIVIPARLPEGVPANDLDCVGLHEAAHLARWDDCAILTERLLLAIFPWHLVARWIVRQIDLEREIACDDRVVAASNSPVAYANSLIRVVALCGGSLDALSVASFETRLSRRVELLLHASRHGNPFLRLTAVLPFTAVLLALIIAAAHAPRLLAFTVYQQEKPMTLPTAKKLAVVAAAAASSVVNPHVARAQTSSPAAQAQPASGRMMALLIDAEGLPAADLQRAAAAAQKFIQEKMASEDRVALLISTTNGIDVRQDFTNDRDLLVKTAADLAYFPGANPPDPSEEWGTALVATLKILARIEGKKAIIGISNVPQIPREKLQTLTDDAVRNQIAIYLVDTSAYLPNRR